MFASPEDESRERMANDPQHQARPASRAKSAKPVRVLVVADGAYIGEKVRTLIDADPALSLAGMVSDGIAAVSFLRRHVADAVVLDIGHAEARVKVTLSRMFRVDPDLKVVMVGSLSFANVKTSMTGLMEGAAEYIPAPAGHTGGSEREFANRLTGVLGAFGRSPREVPTTQTIAWRERSQPQPRPVPAAPPALTLRAPAAAVPEVIAIASSTGGPQALFMVLAMLPADLKVPVLITQHMPAKFTTVLAEHIDRHSGLPCAEGQDGETLMAGRVYVAPSDYHMTVEKSRFGPALIRLNQEPPRNYCRPSADPMLESLADVFGAGVLAAVLTGMGKDGLVGGQAVIEAGGTVIAQDAETSVVWGMPGAVATAGLCSAVLPIDEIAPFLSRALKLEW